jgi:hypothetical protein
MNTLQTKITETPDDSPYDISLGIKSLVKIDNNEIRYIAANPPDYITSFSGSALPFHNEEQAFDDTPNIGSVMLSDTNEAVINVFYPNSYYDELGNVLVKPHIKLFFNVNNTLKQVDVKLSEGIPYRSLTYPIHRSSCMFYDTLDSLPIRSQNDILRSSGYPDEDIHYTNFWGYRPPN